MARFIVGPKGHYRQGQFFNEGDEIELAEGDQPGDDWIPAGQVVAKPPEEQEPQTMSEMAKKRPSDRRV